MGINPLNALNCAGKLQKGYIDNVQALKNLCTGTIAEHVVDEEVKVKLQQELAKHFNNVTMVMMDSDLQKFKSRRF